MLVQPLFDVVSGDQASIGNANNAKPSKVRHLAGYHASKRLIDSLLVALGLVALSPLFMLLAVLIKLDSPGPVLFSQIRVGKHGKLFRCWKFRSMSSDASSSSF